MSKSFSQKLTLQQHVLRLQESIPIQISKDKFKQAQFSNVFPNVFRTLAFSFFLTMVMAWYCVGGGDREGWLPRADIQTTHQTIQNLLGWWGNATMLTYDNLLWD